MHPPHMRRRKGYSKQKRCMKWTLGAIALTPASVRRDDDEPRVKRDLETDLGAKETYLDLLVRSKRDLHLSTMT
jgi:hypothetical protein